MLAFRIERAAYVEHVCRQVAQSAREATLEVRCGVATTGAQFEKRFGRTLAHGICKPDNVGGLSLVRVGRGDQMKPGGKFVIQSHNKIPYHRGQRLSLTQLAAPAANVAMRP